MKKVERLELENRVLRNVIACAMENIEIGKRVGKEEYLILAEVKVNLNFDERMQGALELGCTNDLRNNSMTLEQCESRFKKFGDRVVLNDGMVVSIEY